MQVQLRHDVTDGGEVDLLIAEMIFNELRNDCGFVQYGCSRRVRKIKEFSDSGFWN